MTTDMTTDRQREDRVRRQLDLLGNALRKSRSRNRSITEQLGYRIIDPNSNSFVAGDFFELELGDVEEWCRAEQDRQAGGGLAS